MQGSLNFRFVRSHGQYGPHDSDMVFTAIEVHCRINEENELSWYSGPLETIRHVAGEKTVEYNDDYYMRCETAEDMARHIGHDFPDSAAPGMERKNLTILQQLMFATIALHTLQCVE